MFNHRILGLLAAFAIGCSGAEADTEAASDESDLPLWEIEREYADDSTVSFAPRDIPEKPRCAGPGPREDNSTHPNIELDGYEDDPGDNDDVEITDKVSNVFSARVLAIGSEHQSTLFPIVLPSSAHLDRTSSEPSTLSSRRSEVSNLPRPKLRRIRSTPAAPKQGPTLLVRNEADWEQFKNSGDDRLSFVECIDFRSSNFVPDPLALVLDLPRLRKAILAPRHEDDDWIRAVQNFHEGLHSRRSLEIVIEAPMAPRLNPVADNVHPEPCLENAFTL